MPRFNIAPQNSKRKTARPHDIRSLVQYIPHGGRRARPGRATQPRMLQETGDDRSSSLFTPGRDGASHTASHPTQLPSSWKLFPVPGQLEIDPVLLQPARAEVVLSPAGHIVAQMHRAVPPARRTRPPLQHEPPRRAHPVTRGVDVTAKTIPAAPSPQNR